MKIWAQLTIVVLVISMVWGCVGPKVQTDFDPAADFAAFRTYAFAGMTDVNQGGVLDNSLVRKRIEEMLREQLVNKGLREVGVEESPDLLIHYWVGLKEKQRIQSTGPAVGVYGRRGPYGWGMGHSGVTTYEYTEGTLIIDFVTRGNKELVWRGQMVGTLADSKEENLRRAREAIAEALVNYPPRQVQP